MVSSVTLYQWCDMDKNLNDIQIWSIELMRHILNPFNNCHLFPNLLILGTYIWTVVVSPNIFNVKGELKILTMLLGSSGISAVTNWSVGGVAPCGYICNEGTA